MSAVRELTIALIKSGMDPVEATILIARAGTEMAPPTDTRKPGARRQAAYRERHKASLNVTEVTGDETSRNVTKRHETSQSDAASLSIGSKKEENKKKRESARASQLPEGWRPSPEAWNETTVILGTVDRCEYELKKFKNHALEKGRVAKNWNAAWINWATRAVEYGGRTNGNGTGAGANPASNQSGSTAIIAGVAAATERRARERFAAGQQRTPPADDHAAKKPDPELFGTG